MNADQNQDRIQMMKASVDPWLQSLADPAKAQATVLQQLLNGYKQTEYGKQHGADAVGSYEDYKNSFPVQTYAGFKPFIDKVLAGNSHALLSEEPAFIGTTKGTTGEPKLFPFTAHDAKRGLEMQLRLIFNYAVSKRSFDWMSGYLLNLSPSAKVGKISVGGKEMPYGYSIAVYMLFLEGSARSPFKMMPTPDDMNTLPPEATKANWERRYEFAYEKARDQKITWVGTTPNVLVGFGRYLYQKHQVKPKDLWDIKYVGCGGFSGTHTRFAGPLRSLYGKEAAIRDLYATTEGGILAAQVDDRKAWSPFYDAVLFEVQTIDGVKPMYEMKPGEIGSLVVSSTALPRYRIGDLILAFEPPYFQCIGRENTKLHPYSYGKLTGKSELTLGKSPELPTWR